MTFDAIVQRLFVVDQKIVRDIMALFENVDRRTHAFCRQTGLKCKDSCGACCESPHVETTVTEVLPLAVYLWSQGMAQEVLEEVRSKEFKGPCVLYEPHAFNKGQGRCSVYTYRPGLCRLFGFAARKNKYGQQELMTCKVIKEEQPETCARTQEELRKRLEGPLLTGHAFDVAGIDPVHGHAFMPINQALGQAIEKIGYTLEKIKTIVADPIAEVVYSKHRTMKKTILFIDDNPVDRSLISKLLAKHDFKVLLAEDGPSGLQMAKEHKLDLILLDILLPQISGIELCKKLKSDAATSEVPVIFYTSIDTPKHLIDYASYGACDYIQKTTPPEELISSIKAVLE